MFTKMAEHLNGLASEIEKTIAADGTSASPAELHPVGTIYDAAAADRYNSISPNPVTTVPHEVVTANVAAPEEEKGSRRIFAWRLIIVVALTTGLLLWASSYEGANEVLFSSIARSKNDPSALPDESKQAMPTLEGEQSERKAILEQLEALAARIDRLTAKLDNLKNAPAQVEGPLGLSAEEKPTTTESKPPAQEKSSPPYDGDRTFTVQSPIAAKPPANPGGNPPNVSAGRIGASESDQRGLTIGPAGCAHFRSFDAVSGTYVTFDGRRRPCRKE